MKLVFIVIDQGETNRGLEYSLRYLSHRYNAIENKYKRGYFHEAHRFIGVFSNVKMSFVVLVCELK